MNRFLQAVALEFWSIPLPLHMCKFSEVTSSKDIATQASSTVYTGGSNACEAINNSVCNN